MGDPRDKDLVTDLLDLFGKVDRIVALAALALTYLSNSAKQPVLSIVFVVVACIALDTWLWRLVNSKVSIKIVGQDGQAATRPRFSFWQVFALKALAVITTATCVAWITFFPLCELLRPPLATSSPTPSPSPVARPPCKPPVPLEWNSMVCVPAGVFWMGTDDGPEDTRPKHQVYLSAFWVDKNEVSVEEYSKFLDDRPALKRPPSWTQGLKLKYPITEVSWQDAQAFCNAQGKLLPTEAQWEKAARGEDGRAYPWGNDELDAQKANSSKNPLNALWPIGSAPAGASPYGVLDMAGNAAEWVRDYYQADYYPSAPSNDPRGPDMSLEGTRVVRGGSFNYPPDLLRTFVRLGIYPEYAIVNTVGFRCVLEP